MDCSQGFHAGEDKHGRVPRKPLPVWNFLRFAAPSPHVYACPRGAAKNSFPLSVVDTHREASDGVETGESGQQATGIYDILNGRQSVPAESPFR